MKAFINDFVIVSCIWLEWESYV